MTQSDVIESLETLGLSNYEAQVLVALQRLGTGTAEDVSEVSDVPRSQVYGAADDLAERGLLEVLESSPKAYRPVALSSARELLTKRIERETTLAFDQLESLRETASEHVTGEGVSTLRGRQPIDDRITALLEQAADTVVLVAPEATALTEAIVGALHDSATTGVDVTIVTADRSIPDRFAGGPVKVIVMAEDNPADFAGRALMIDDRTVLLAAETDGGPLEEEAMWTGESRIGRILAEFMRSGMESGRDRRPPAGYGRGRDRPDEETTRENDEAETERARERDRNDGQ